MSKDNGTTLNLTGDGAAYVRVSDDQQDTSRQYASIRAFAERHGVTIPDHLWFKDEGWARDTADRRPDFQRLVSLAESGKVKWIVVDALDRFGTKSTKQLFHYLFRLEEAGCRLFDVAGKEWTGEDDSTEITAWVGGKQSVREQRDKSHRVQGAQAGYAKAGEWQGGPPPLGLDLACCSEGSDTELWRVVFEGGETVGWKEDKRGRKRPVKKIKRLKVYPEGSGKAPEQFDGSGFPAREESQILRITPSRDQSKVDAAVSVFKRFATETISFTCLARDLTKAGFHTATGGFIQGNHVERMLRNPAYTGRFAWNRRHVGKFHRYKGSQAVLELNFDEKESDNDTEDWVISDRELFPPLVDKETWEVVQKRLAQLDQGKRTRAPQTAEEYLSGLVFCGNCGRVMNVHPVRRKSGTRYEFFCSTYHRHTVSKRAKESPCFRNSIFQSGIQTYIDSWLEEVPNRLEMLMRDVNGALKSGSLPDLRVEKVDEYWRDFGQGLNRLTAYLAQHHPAEFAAIVEEDKARRAEELASRDSPSTPLGVLDRFGDSMTEAIKEAVKRPISDTPSHPDINACLDAYRANFDPAKVEDELARLDAEHTSLYRRYADLPTKLAKEKAGAELAEL